MILPGADSESMRRQTARGMRSPWAGAAMVASVVLAAKALLVFFVPLRALAMTPWLMDDSFIFATIARNLSEGKGCSLDGVHPTAGAPLLWIWIISLPHRLCSDTEAVKASILVGASCAALASVLVFKVARSCASRNVAWTAFSLSLFAAPGFCNSLNAMDTALFTCLGMAIAALHFGTSPRHRSAVSFWIASGTLQGLLLLARADAVFLTIAITAMELRWTGAPIRTREMPSDPSQREPMRLRSDPPTQSDRTEWSDPNRAGPRLSRRTGIVLMLGGVALSAFVIAGWNLHATGSVWPSNQVGRRLLAWESVSAAGMPMALVLYAKKVLWYAFQMHNLLALSLGSFGLVVIASAASLGATPRHRYETLRSFSVLALAYLIPYAGALIFYQGYFPDFHGLRYLDLAAHLITIPVAWFLVEFIPVQVSARAWRVAAPLLGILGLLAGSWGGYERLMVTRTWAAGMESIPRYDRETVDTWWQFLDRARDEIPRDSVVAVKDFGRFAFFTHLRVVDLAGITDPRLLESRKRGELAQFLQREGTDYVLAPAEGGFPVHREIARTMALVPMDNFPAQEGTGYMLHRLAPPRPPAVPTR